MDIIEFATKTLGLQLNSAQIELLHEVDNNPNSFICFPRNNGRQMCYNILERYKGYKQRLEEDITQKEQIALEKELKILTSKFIKEFRKNNVKQIKEYKELVNQ